MPARTVPDQKTRVTLLGSVVNLVLSSVKITAGLVLVSPALVADGVHSLADLASDVMVLWALRHAGRAPDDDHPYGHGRFETLATLALSVFLALTGLLIGWDGLRRMLDPAGPVPGFWALAVAALSIAVKEALFRYTLNEGRKTGSALLQANAWHHRSDALSSIVALVGIGASALGFGYGDPMAACVIAAMLVVMGWRFGAEASVELVDTQPPEDMRATLQACLTTTPGVRDLRDLRMRRHGARMLADVSVMVDPDITITEAHRIAEAARAQALASIDALEDLVIHIEPAGHFDDRAVSHTPLRPEIEGTIRTLLLAHPMLRQIEAIRLDYYESGLQVEVVVDLDPDADPVTVEWQITSAISVALPDVRQTRLHRISSGLRD